MEILYFGYSENIKAGLLKTYEDSNSCLRIFLNNGNRLGFSFFKVQNPKRFYEQVLESFNRLYKVFPRCQGL
ncbi:MAG: hypothetical protein ABIL61_07085 [candidate division WOR-3 bacterium]